MGWCAGLALGTMVCGLVWRMAPLGLPQFWFKYGGSMLWAAMVYLIVAALLPQWRPWGVGVVAAVIAASVEMVRLVHAPGLDAFRETLAGRLLLGKYFAVADIAAYWVAILLVCAMDAWVVLGTRR